MNSTVFDDITNAFLATLEAGTVSLGAFSLPLLGAFALIGWYWTFGRQLAMGGGQLGDALASALLYAVNIGVAYWLLTNLAPLGTAAYQTFLQWGLAAGGGATAGLLVTPSTVVDMGFKIAAPLVDYAARQTGWAVLWNGAQMLMYNLATIAIVVSFPFVAIALMMTQIEYHLSIMICAILLPFSVFGPTSFLAEFCVGWATGCLIRVLVTAVILGAGFPLFTTAVVALTAGNDPTRYSSSIVALISLLYTGLVWWIPNKAAGMCGRVAIGLSGATVVSGAMGIARVPMAAASAVSAVRGVSQMMQGRRAA